MPNPKEAPRKLEIKKLTPDDLKKFNDKAEKVQDALVKVQEKNDEMFGHHFSTGIYKE